VAALTGEIAICLAILGVAISLFATERIPADVVAIGVMLSLAITGVLEPARAFAGFGSDTVIMILGLLIMTEALAHTGVVDTAGRAILDYTGRNPALQLPGIMLSVAVLSAFISNTAATAFFIPVVLGFAKKSRVSPSRYLLPLAFASILTSSVTLISTSTNIVVSELMTDYRMPAMGMFELAPVGIPISVVGLLYMWRIGVHLMPQREPREETADIGHRTYQADLVLAPGSALSGKTVEESGIEQKTGLKVVSLVRNGRKVRNFNQSPLEEGDELVIEGQRADILKVKGMTGLVLKADAKLVDPAVEQEELAIVEGVLLPHSPLIGRTLKSAWFHERYGLQVLGINRAGVTIPRKLSEIPLRLGDVLLLQGTPENVQALERGNLFNIFSGVDRRGLNVKRARLTIGIYVLSLAAGTFKLVTLPIAVLTGALMMLLTRCISPEEAYRRVEWKVLILIGSMLSLGAAMETTGAGKYLALQLIALVGTQSGLLMLACFFALTVALTQPMSNQAAAIVIIPIAIETALHLGLNPRTFAMMVAVAASCSYLTPLEPSCLMVYGPGRYRFIDFFKVGLPLTFVIFVIALVLVPWVWPLGG
jgi:di/tricarboxylate transporter